MAKYRPSLKAEHITHIIATLKSGTVSQLDMEVLKVLVPFEAKINNGIIVPASIPTPKQSIEESLGMLPAPTASLTKEQQWEQSYQLYKRDPANCTLQIIAEAKEHMYLHNLMTPEEAAEFEAAEFNSPNSPNIGN